MRHTLPPPEMLYAILDRLAGRVHIYNPSGRILYVNRTLDESYP